MRKKLKINYIRVFPFIYLFINALGEDSRNTTYCGCLWMTGYWVLLKKKLYMLWCNLHLFCRNFFIACKINGEKVKY